MRFDAAPLAGYVEPYGLLCGILQDGTREWRFELDPELPEEALVWQAYPGGHSIGGIIFHIVAVEIFWFEEVALNIPYNPEEMQRLLAHKTNVDEWRWPEPPRQPLSWYFELHDQVRARTLERIREWPPADTSRGDDERQCTLRWVLGHVIQHESYHGGQAVLLNRLWRLRDA
jgi:uncharacterized damage-inducible protein DinB